MNKEVKLKITDLTWNGGNQVKPDTTVVFTVTLTNEGTADMIEGEQYTVMQVYTDRDCLGWIEYGGGLKAGETKTFESKEWVATPGNHVISAALNFAQPSPNNWETGLILVKYMHVAEEALPVPEFAAEAGMNTLLFSDDFTTLDTIDVNATGEMGYHWYVTRPFGASNVLPDDYELTDDGILLRIKKGAFNYGITMFDSRTGAGSGFKHGYMEVRFKVASNRTVPDTKGSPAIWAMPAERYWWFDNHWLEMDFMEYWGNKYGPDHKLFTVTMHEQACEYGSGKGNTQWVRNDKSMYFWGLGDDDWHTMGWLWEEGLLKTYKDGKCIKTQKWGKDHPMGEPELHVVTGEMGDAPFTVFDKYSYPVTICGAYGWPMEVDYFQIWVK